MLVLSRKPGEKVAVGDNVTLTVVEVKGSQVRLAFDSPPSVRILRGELQGGSNQAVPEEELADPDLAEKPDEWRDVILPFVRPLPAARVVAMAKHLPQQRPGCFGEMKVPSVAKGLRILLVTEDVRTAEAMAQVLRQSGHQVRITPDVASALQAAEKDDSDVMLLESNVSGLDVIGNKLSVRKRLCMLGFWACFFRGFRVTSPNVLGQKAYSR